MRITFTSRSTFNDYIIVKDIDNADSDNRLYEHRVIAKEELKRELDPTEEVHHFDGNRANNSPDNLLVLNKDQHIKLHAWLDKNIIVPKPKQLIRNMKGCIRCAECQKPIHPSKKKFCTHECRIAHRKKELMLETPVSYLQKLIKSHPITTIANIIGLTDSGVRRRCKALGIDHKTGLLL